MYAQTTRGQVNTHVIQGRCLRLVFVIDSCRKYSLWLGKKDSVEVPPRTYSFTSRASSELGYYSSEFVFTNKIIDFYVT